MLNEVRGGVVLSAVEAGTFEYLPNKGVFLGGLLDRGHGNPFGLYIGRIEPGIEVAARRTRILTARRAPA
jgi:hypothetical protein